MSQYIDIIIFALLAVFLFLKLRNVSGEFDEDADVTDGNRPRRENEESGEGNKSGDAAVIKKIAASSAVADALRAMQARDSGFEVSGFVRSAEAAYKMIIKAYISGDVSVLRMLLSPEIFIRFEREIENRAKEKRTSEIIIKAIKNIRITDVDVRERFTKIEAEFTAEEIAFSKDEKGAVTAGSMTDVITVTDRWVFEKQTDNKDPTWYLVETRDEIEDII